MTNQLLSLLGIAQRAGKLAWGRDAAVESLRKGKASLVLLACDLSAKTVEGICFEANRQGVAAVQVCETIESISRAIGKRGGIVAINDNGFAEKLNELAVKNAEGSRLITKGRDISE